MSDTITVVESGTEIEIPQDFGSTPQEFAEAAGYNDSKEWRVFRDKPYKGGKMPPEHECDEPMVVDDGDEFITIPKHAGEA